MNTANLDQTHSFWINLWSYLRRFDGTLSAEEMQSVMTKVSNPDGHPFWPKFKEAIQTIVTLPKPRDCFQFRTEGVFAERPTKNCFDYRDLVLEISPQLKKQFPLEQPGSDNGVFYERYHYGDHDFDVLGQTAKLFPNHFDTPFSTKGQLINRVERIFPLTRINQFMHVKYLGKKIESSTKNSQPVICDPHSDNVFFVHGRKNPLMISVRWKLNKWKMKLVQPGDKFWGPDVYFFT